LYIHVQINVARLLIENDVVDINNEILTSITNNRLVVLKPDVYWWTHTCPLLLIWTRTSCPTKCHLLLNWTKSIRNDLYVHTHQIIKSGAYDEKNNVFVQNQVIKYRFKMIRLHDTVIVLDIVITNWE
jgi:hypothetical protein